MLINEFLVKPNEVFCWNRNGSYNFSGVLMIIKYWKTIGILTHIQVCKI